MKYQVRTPLHLVRGAFGVLCLVLLSGCKPTISFSALETSIVELGSTTLEWEVDFTTGSGSKVVEIQPDIGVVEEEGAVVVTPDKTTTYKLVTRTFVYGFPMFVNEELTVEVKEGDFWDFSVLDGRKGEWSFFEANYVEQNVTDYQFISEIDQLIPSPIDKEGVRLAANHINIEDEDIKKVILYGKVQRTGLEEDTTYEVGVNVVYAIAARLDGTGEEDCDTEAISLSVYTGLEQPENETNDEDLVTITNLGTKRELLDDIRINDDECDDGIDGGFFETSSATTGTTPISITTDSDGDLWLVVALESSPKFDVYIQSVSAFFDEK